jgi:hypothetical protein
MAFFWEEGRGGSARARRLTTGGGRGEVPRDKERGEGRKRGEEKRRGEERRGEERRGEERRGEERK